ncbi:hypothetical protein GH794_15880, partial [Listeria monocytogenes]|nr:hypothetical protein [Listeria monocytogenes]
NDGSVDGKRYFTCRSSSGVFVRPSQVTPSNETKAASSVSLNLISKQQAG